MSIAESEAKKRWDKENTVFVAVKLNRNTDADIIEAIGNPDSKAGRIKELIRKAIEKENP